MRVALIDGDSISWILGYVNREHQDVSIMEPQLDSMVKAILNNTNAGGYILALSPSKCFRNDVYRYQKYKGKRPVKPEWCNHWQPIINFYLRQVWKAISCEGVEADDIISFAAEYYGNAPDPDDYVICSIDKDLKQIPGEHFNYSTGTGLMVSADEADYNFWYQMLVGDTTDNIAGVPGMGPVKAKVLLSMIENPIERAMNVQAAYYKYFGEFYGGIIFQETKATVELMCQSHILYGTYGNKISSNLRINKYIKDSNVDEGILKALGWAV